MFDNLKGRIQQLEPPARYTALAGAVAALAFVAYVLTQVVPPLLIELRPFIIIAVVFVLYWLPTVIAFRRGHVSRGGILVLNLVAGWTIVGWVICLIWSVGNAGTAPGMTVITNVVAPAPPMPMAAYPQVGDVVNGHVFNGQQWLPLSPPPTQPPITPASDESR